MDPDSPEPIAPAPSAPEEAPSPEVVAPTQDVAPVTPVQDAVQVAPIMDEQPVVSEPISTTEPVPEEPLPVQQPVVPVEPSVPMPDQPTIVEPAPVVSAPVFTPVTTPSPVVTPAQPPAPWNPHSAEEINFLKTVLESRSVAARKAQVADRLERLVEHARQRGSIDRTEARLFLKVGGSTATRYLMALVRQGRLVRTGMSRKAKYTAG